MLQQFPLTLTLTDLFAQNFNYPHQHEVVYHQKMIQEKIGRQRQHVICAKRMVVKTYTRLLKINQHQQQQHQRQQPSCGFLLRPVARLLQPVLKVPNSKKVILKKVVKLRNAEERRGKSVKLKRKDAARKRRVKREVAEKKELGAANYSNNLMIYDHL